MAKRLLYGLKWLLVVALIVPLLAACTYTVSESFPLESVNKNGKETSYVYRAENQTVPEVAQEIADEKKPKEISKEDMERMFLVYSDEIYHIQKDPNKPEDTLIEVSSKEYVRNNYASDFLRGYITASILGSLFDSVGSWGSGNYRGYGTKDTYKPKTDYTKPTEQDKKAKPPITVNKTGSITKRNSSGTSSKSSSSDNKSNDSGGIFGKITRNSGDSSSSGSSGSSSSSKSSSVTKKPPKVSSPKTGFGKTGSIKRRR
ncbi:DUF4247 domain-containing protein [Paenibacillus albiflavus]|uniref:DUF4247 domain-containing protein n=1 Tax=Paenibacillus albiflavus TaxID=2545760 RepID=A0A4R4ENE2_9BACL|nr:DUF4247 domain-containing protein [Paenibacillus albiflavus]TCZ80041.1 DUF4247 domain-containing protein [Paenibacillus albiflavus]